MGVGYAAVVETVVGLTTVVEAIRPGVAELEGIFHTYIVVGGYILVAHTPSLPPS